MIRAREVRVVGDQGEQLGVMTVPQARELAERRGLDLVEVAPTAVPPVCRLMDYGKFKYTQTKKEKESRKSQKATEIREIRVRPKIGDHDFDAKARTARKLLEGGDKVKVTVMFRGRENTHSELGVALIEKMADQLKDIATVEKLPTREGARVHLILNPISMKGKKEAVKAEEISTDDEDIDIIESEKEGITEDAKAENA